MTIIALVIISHTLLAVVLRIIYRVQVKEHIIEFLSVTGPTTNNRWSIDLVITLSLPVAACSLLCAFLYDRFRRES